METIYEEMGDDRTCRICYEEGGHDLIAPCLCKGSCKWVHRSCLDKWRVSDSGYNSFNQCPQCKFHYIFEQKMDKCKYRAAIGKFTLFMALELCLMAFIAVFVVCLNTLGVMVYMGNYMCFEYFANTLPMGIFVTLVTVGLVTVLFYLCSPSVNTTTSSYNNSGGDTYNFFNFGSSRRQCRYKNGRRNGCTCIRCDEDNGGGDCKDLIVIIAIVLAVLGLIMIVLFSVAYLADKTRIHWQKVWRGNIVDEYVVKHLNKEDHVV